jgi:RHS repeat-associated protein/uncharacterized protein (TIGR03382 family)
VIHAAKQLVRDAPTLSADDAHNRLLSVLEKLRSWMEKYDVPTPSLIGVLAATTRGNEDFGATMSAYLNRRATGVAFGQEDLNLLETLVKLAGKAEVQQAVENDPTWRYTHDANGAVTSVTVEIPAFVLNLTPAPAVPISSPIIHNTMCYRYDTRQRLVKVETVLRRGVQVASVIAPCSDIPALVPMATFRYDEANRRVYSNVAGKESWEVRGPAGELLAEVSRAGEVERAYVYLDGEPLAMVALTPGKALRSPTTPLGCASTEGLPGWMAALVVLLVVVRKRRLARRPGASAAGAVLLVLLLSGCDPQEPPALPVPSPGAAPGAVFYFHNDRLGTPVRLTDEAGRTVWRADYRPFGEVQRLETDPDGDGKHIEQPLRFPGQYDDSMSALILAQGPYYNWNRFYEPATGRYLSPEPLLQNPRWVRQMAERGLSATTYAYALNNPVHYSDPTGRGPEALPMIYYAGMGLVAATVWYYAYIQQHPILIPLPPASYPRSGSATTTPPAGPTGSSAAAAGAAACALGAAAAGVHAATTMVCTLSPDTPAPVPGQLVDSCFHLVHSSEVLKEANAKNFSSDLRAGVGGIAVKILSLAKTERPNEMPIQFSNYSADGFVVRIEREQPEFPQAFFAAFAVDVRLESQGLAFRISKSSLEALLSDWLARGRPPSDSRAPAER